MARTKQSPLEQQLSRAHRRLLTQSILNSVIIGWVAGLLLAAGWFLVQPFALDRPAGWLGWAITGGLLGLATVLGIFAGWMRAPGKLAAALSLDSKFGLKERVTTSVTLTAQQIETPVGQALLADATIRVKDLDVGSGFPVALSWTAGLVPLAAGALVLVAMFYAPLKSRATAAKEADRTEPPANAADIEKKIKQLTKKKEHEKLPGDRTKSEELARLENELEKIANKPHGTKEEVRERIKEMTALEDVMKQREKQMADRTRSLKQQLQRLDRLAEQNSEGPAKDLQKALSEGKFDKAREELDRLTKKLQKNQLTAGEKEQLKKQLDGLQKKLERLAQLKDKEEQLKKANLDPETLKREQDQLKKEKEKLKPLDDLAKQLGMCQKALKEGNMNDAIDQLSKAGEKVKSMEMQEDDLQDLKEQLSRLHDAKDSC
jgi:hypothetical protein